jgi:hypothetical protein
LLTTGYDYSTEKMVKFSRFFAARRRQRLWRAKGISSPMHYNGQALLTGTYRAKILEDFA